MRCYPVNHVTRFVIALAALLAGSTALAEAPKWKLAWQDDFTSLDESTWTLINTTKTTNNSLQAYLPELLTVENGKLVITATDEAYEELPYRSGQVISRAEQRFGRWEVRAKLPTSKGMWPAIWLLPDVKKHPWPSGGEIDIMENRGNQPLLTSSAFHYGTNPPFRHDFVFQEQQTTLDGKSVNYHDSFHTYTVDWTERYLRFYVDGVNHYTVYDQDVENFLSESTKPMQLVINNAIGGTFLPDPDATTEWPQRMEIDWVRVYELEDQPGTAEFANGGFEADGGTLSGWSLFGVNSAAIQNILSSRETVLEGKTSLKMYGGFGAAGQFSGVSQGITVSPGMAVEASASAFVRSQDSISGTGNRLLMKIEFYDAFGAKYNDGLLGESETLLADGGTPNDTWQAHELEATAPAEAVEARLVLVFDQPSDEGGAAHVDAVSFQAVP